jgi:hypothetical protein
VALFTFLLHGETGSFFFCPQCPFSWMFNKKFSQICFDPPGCWGEQG